MVKKVQDQLKDNVPLALKNNDLIDGYVEAIGEVFEEIRQDINYRKYSTDYAKSKTATFDLVTSNIGLKLSSFIRESVTRRLIRDMPLIYSRMGTRDSLILILKTLGYRNFQVDETWVPNPDLVRKGYYRSLVDTGEPVRYNLSQNSYTDFVVGSEYVTEQGTFFKGYTYNDFDRENEISGIPIYGETYSTYTGLSFKNMVSKTPYIVVKIYEPPSFDEVITDVDPETGLPISISVEEKQTIITEAVVSLIKNLQRAATTSIILVTSLLRNTFVMDEMLDDFEITHSTLAPPEYTETVEILDDIVNDGRLIFGTNNVELIGSYNLIGKNYPNDAIGEYTTPGVIGTTPVETDILDTVRGVDTTTFAINPANNDQHVHYLDYNATVSFTAPAGVNGIVVESIRNFRWSDPSERVTLATINAGQTFNQSVPDSHAVILTFTNGFTGSITITSTY